MFLLGWVDNLKLFSGLCSCLFCRAYLIPFHPELLVFVILDLEDQVFHPLFIVFMLFNDSVEC
jgi:hypothetical protein